MIHMPIPAEGERHRPENHAGPDRCASADGPSRPEATTEILASRRILVVDDDRDSANSLAAVFAVLGFRVERAYDAPAALAIAERWRPDVAIVDVAMPGMDGYTLARWLRAGPWGRDVVLIALTGFTGDEHRRRSIEAGFDDYLVKPARIDVIVASVKGSRSGCLMC